MIAWSVNRHEDRLTLVEAMARRIPSAPHAYLRQLCKTRRVICAGKSADPSTRVSVGEQICISPSARLDQCLIDARLTPAQILYEDRECIVLDKPTGLLVHPAYGHHDDLLSRLKTFLDLRGDHFQVAAIHRLDLGTSGPVLFGKGRAAIRQLGQMFMAGTVTKGYLALVEGTPPPQGTLASPVPAHGSYRAATTHFRRVGCGSAMALLDIRLITGRRHQIRRQLADAGWPLVGDRRYGSNAGSDLLLHCHLLAFNQPITATAVRVQAPLPGTADAALDEAGIAPSCLTEWEEFSVQPVKG